MLLIIVINNINIIRIVCNNNDDNNIFLIRCNCNSPYLVILTVCVSTVSDEPNTGSDIMTTNFVETSTQMFKKIVYNQ